jgi:hypothetical protein
MKAETIQSAKEMLHLLRDLVSDSEEVYNGIVWQLVCCPFTPFLALFGEILANKGAKQEADWQALAAMKELPAFLKKMGVRNSLAAKLEHIAVVIVRHAESVVDSPQCTCERPLLCPREKDQTNNKAVAAALNVAAPSSHEINDFDLESFLNHTTTSALPDQAQWQGYGSEPTPFGDVGDATLWTDMFLGDTNIDWIGLGDSLFA